MRKMVQIVQKHFLDPFGDESIFKIYIFCCVSPSQNTRPFHDQLKIPGQGAVERPAGCNHLHGM